MNKSCHEIKSLLSGYIDGDIGKKERLRIEDHLIECAVCRSEVEYERQIIDVLSALPVQDCPARVTQKIENVIASATQKPKSRIKWSIRPELLHWKPLYVGFALTMILLFILFKPFVTREDTVPVPVPVTQEELLKVKNQAKWSLAYIADKLQDAQKEAVEDVLMKKLPRTFRQSIRNTFSSSKGGKK